MKGYAASTRFELSHVNTLLVSAATATVAPVVELLLPDTVPSHKMLYRKGLPANSLLMYVTSKQIEQEGPGWSGLVRF